MRAATILFLLLAVPLVHAYFEERAYWSEEGVMNNQSNAILAAAADPQKIHQLNYLIPFWNHFWNIYDPEVVKRTQETLATTTFRWVYGHTSDGGVKSLVFFKFRNYPGQLHHIFLVNNKSSPTGYKIASYMAVDKCLMKHVTYKCDLYCVIRYIFGLKPLPAYDGSRIEPDCDNMSPVWNFDKWIY